MGKIKIKGYEMSINENTNESYVAGMLNSTGLK